MTETPIFDSLVSEVAGIDPAGGTKALFRHIEDETDGTADAKRITRRVAQPRQSARAKKA